MSRRLSPLEDWITLGEAEKRFTPHKFWWAVEIARAAPDPNSSYTLQSQTAAAIGRLYKGWEAPSVRCHFWAYYNIWLLCVEDLEAWAAWYVGRILESHPEL